MNSQHQGFLGKHILPGKKCDYHLGKHRQVISKITSNSKYSLVGVNHSISIWKRNNLTHTIDYLPIEFPYYQWKTWLKKSRITRVVWMNCKAWNCLRLWFRTTCCRFVLRISSAWGSHSEIPSQSYKSIIELHVA